MDEGAVEVWFAFVPEVEDPDEARLQLSLLSDDERERCMRRSSGARRREFRAARALVRRALSRQGDPAPEAWRFVEGAHGRPSIDSPPGEGLDFNLSHTAGLVACAVGRGVRVGVDVECLDRRRSADLIAKRMFDPAERRDLEKYAGEARSRRFLEYWTLKEAALKAEGRGLAGGARFLRFELEGDETRCQRVDAPEGASDAWCFQRGWPSHRHALAIAVLGTDVASIEVREWEEG